MHIPEVFKRFMEKHPEIADASQRVGELCTDAGPLDVKAKHLIQLGISVGTASKGGVRSHARRALDAGASEEEVVQTVLLATSIIGFPTMMASYAWLEEVLQARKE